jgi:hypothetical protein
MSFCIIAIILSALLYITTFVPSIVFIKEANKNTNHVLPSLIISVNILVRLYYYLRPILLFANMDISRHILMIDPSVLAKSNMDRRDYKNIANTYIYICINNCLTILIRSCCFSIVSKVWSGYWEMCPTVRTLLNMTLLALPIPSCISEFWDSCGR